MLRRQALRIADGPARRPVLAVQEDTTMRPIAIILLGLSLVVGIECSASAETCQKCRDQQRACMKNYPGKTCQVEYGICVKGCTGK